MEALYTRYRPRTFAEVRGQEHATNALIRALSTDRVHHAYLFSGPRGCGKTSSARILAASINCIEGPTPNPCGVCEQCVDIRKGTSLDVIEIDAASNGSVDDARDLRDRVLFAPASARCKIYIIDEAHMLSREANNALLKVVEEPPPHVKFVFATTEPDKILPTIRSRTFHYHFRLVPPRQLIAHLQEICEKEGVAVDPAVLPLVVGAGGGSVRDSMSILDQLIAGAGPDGVEYASAVALLGLTDDALLDGALAALSARDGAGLLSAVDRVVSSGHDPRRFAMDLLSRLRDLLVLETVPDAGERGLLESMPIDQRDRMRGYAAAMGGAELSRSADLLHAGLVEMRGTANPRLLLELICARMLLPGADPASLALRLDRVERGLSTHRPVVSTADTPQDSPDKRPLGGGGGEETRPAAGSVQSASDDAVRTAAGSAPSASRDAARTTRRPVVSTADTPQDSPDKRPLGGGGGAAVGEIDLGKLKVLWPQVVEATKTRKRATHALLSVYARLVDADSSTITLHFELAPIARQYQSGVNVEVTREAINEILGFSPMVKVVIGTPPPEVGEQPAATQPDPVALEPGTPATTPATPLAPPADPHQGEASIDDEDAPSFGSGEDAALSVLQAELGATVVSRVDEL